MSKSETNSNLQRQRVKRLPSFALICLAAMTLGCPLRLQAGSMNVPRTPTPSHQEIVISQIKPEEIVIEERIVADKGKIEEKRSKSFRITKFTEIMVNGRRGAIAQLRPGMRVHVTAGTDRTVAARIEANG
jgi:hypothetical protein